MFDDTQGHDNYCDSPVQIINDHVLTISYEIHELCPPIYTCMYTQTIYMYTLYIYMRTYLHTHAQIDVHIYIYTLYMYTCAYIYFTYIYIYIYVHLCTHVCMYL